MKVEKYKNRYGDEYTFTLQEDGNIKWEGDFKYYRVGYPNDYTKAIEEYIRDGNQVKSLEAFKELVHEYNDDTREYTLKDDKYRKLVTSDMSKIDMVDPSGGCYIAVGSTEMGMRVIGFEKIETGYLILTEPINKLLTPLKLLFLTYGETPKDFYDGFPVLQKEVNNVTKRWQEFVEKNFVLKPDSKERLKVLTALNDLVDMIDYQRDEKAYFKFKRINTIIEYIEKQGQ